MGTRSFCLHPQGFIALPDSAQVRACSVIHARLEERQWLLAGALGRLWQPLSSVLDLVSAPGGQHSSRDSLSGWHVGRGGVRG